MENTAKPARKWDPIVKLTHWGVALVIVCNALIVGEGSIAHIYAGYFLAALIGLRLLWGLIGSANARFSAFPPRPVAALGHARDIVAGRKEAHTSHNPLGALMAYALWGCLLVIIGSGIAMAGAPPAITTPVSVSQLVSEGEEEEGEGEHEEYGEGGEEGEGEEIFEEVHEIAVNLLYILIFLHIGGVALETARSGRRTVTAMLPGGR